MHKVLRGTPGPIGLGVWGLGFREFRAPTQVLGLGWVGLLPKKLQVLLGLKQDRPSTTLNPSSKRLRPPPGNLCSHEPQASPNPKP